MMKSLKRFSFSAAILALLLLAGCTVHVADPYFPRHSAQANIPPGHLPPPGECRIWYPDRPPGHQPPPGDCRALSRRVPPGAELIYGR
jgi:hypothetical protein